MNLITMHGMYVCLCNGVKDSDICKAVAEGCASVGQLYRQLGCQPQCGKCVPFVRENYLSDPLSITE